MQLEPVELENSVLLGGKTPTHLQSEVFSGKDTDHDAGGQQGKGSCYFPSGNSCRRALEVALITITGGQGDLLLDQSLNTEEGLL